MKADLEKKYKKEYSSLYQSLEAIWNVLRLYSSEEHPLTVQEIFDHLKRTEELPPSLERLKRLLGQETGAIQALYPTLELREWTPPSYSTIDNHLKRIQSYGGNTPHELCCVAYKRQWNGELKAAPYGDIEAYSTDDKNNVRRWYYLKGPLSDGAWRLLSDFVRDYPGITRVQTNEILDGLDLLVQPRRPCAVGWGSAKPDYSDTLSIIEEIDRAIRKGRKLLVTVGRYALVRRGGRLAPVLRPGEEVELAPYGLTWAGGHCWLVGREQEAVTLRLDRLLCVKSLEETFEFSEQFDTAASSRIPIGKQTVVRLRCSPELLEDVVDMLGRKAQYSALREDETFEVLAPADFERVKSLALGRPGGVEVLEPEELRRDILDTLRQGMERYGARSEPQE